MVYIEVDLYSTGRGLLSVQNDWMLFCPSDLES